MRKLFFAVLYLAISHLIFAQVDTAHIDLGAIRLNKALTQTITIKAKDLQQFPFANLSEAINIWFHGALTERTSIKYVVDGNPLADANVLNIHDIEEITLVQNAATVYSTVGVKQLVLIRTKRTADNGNSVQAAAQSYVVSQPFYNPIDRKTTASEKGIYHQYYLGYRKKINHLSFGVSANYLHDVTPRPKDFAYNKSKPFQLNRFRFNGYADQQLGKSTVLSLSLNYHPQRMVNELEYSTGNTGISYNTDFLFSQKNNVFNGSVALQSNFGKGWFNQFIAAYSSYNAHANNNTSVVFFNGHQNNERDSTFEARSFWARNQVGYIAKAGNWQFEPSINVIYRSVNDRFHAQNIRTANNTITEIAEYNSNQKGYLVYLVPSFGIQYKNLLSLQTGFLQSLKKQPNDFKKFMPYVSASANIVGLIEPGAKWSLHTFASYAVANDFGETYWAPNDLVSYSIFGNMEPRYVRGNSDGIKQLQLGATATFFNNQLQFSYNRYQSEFQEQLRMASPGGGGPFYYLTPFDAKDIVSRAGVTLRLFDDTDSKWTTGFNASTRNFKLQSGQTLPGTTKQPKEWTGGWVNRLQYHSFSFQLDFAYWTNRQWFNSLAIPQRMEKANSISLQHFNVGYRIKQLEVYAGARNLFENKKMTFLDGRRYYGGGARISL